MFHTSPKDFIPLTLILFALLCNFPSCSSKGKIPPKAIKGVLDLRDWDFGSLGAMTPSTGSGTEGTGKILGNSKNTPEASMPFYVLGAEDPKANKGDGIVKLDGEWEFYWEEFPTVDENGVLHLSEKNKNFIEVPSTWNGYVVQEKLENGEVKQKEIGSFGYATYRLKVILPEVQPIEMRIPEMASNYKIYYNNIFLLEKGKIGISEETSIPDKSTKYITILPDSNEFFLTLLISNYSNNKGGFYYSIFFGDLEEINILKYNNLGLDLFVAGVLFIMGVYHLALFYLKRDDLSTLYFGIYCLLIFLRTLVTGENSLDSLLPFVSYSLNIKIEFLTLYVGAFVFNEFISVLFPKERMPFIKKLVTVYTGLYSIITLFLTPLQFTKILSSFQIFLSVYIIYVIYIFIFAIIRKRLGAKTFLFGFLIFATVVINDILYTNQIINTNFLSPYGFIFFIFYQAFLLTSRFANAFHEVKDLSENLEKRVIDRTRDIEEQKQQIIEANLNAQQALQKSNDLNQMIHIVVQSKNIDEMFTKLFELFSSRYGLTSYMMYALDKDDNFLKFHKIYGNGKVDKEYLDLTLKNHLSIEDKNSLHGTCVKSRRSILVKKVRLPHAYKPEEENLIQGGLTSFYIIPLISDEEVFGTITFPDSKFEKSNVQKISKNDREEIENFIKLVSPSIFQSLQKQQIQKAYDELQETQAQLIEAERMASLGQLVGGIAHEINNPIAAIRSHAELLERNTRTTLEEIPPFLDSLSIHEKTLFFTIVNSSLGQKEFFTTKEERKLRKDLQSQLASLLHEESLRATIIDHLTMLRLSPPYETYLETLGAEKFQKFLSMAEVFKSQSNSLSSIEISVEKASRVIFALRSYLNTGLHSEKKEVDLVGEIEKALKVYDNYIVGKVFVRKEFPKELQYSCIAENMIQVWKNIIFNSIQATYHTEKKLEISLERVENIPDSLKSYKTSSIVEDSLFQRKDVRHWILVRFIDSGVGISPELQEKVFTPFFTTKSTGEGIGLGLYTCKKIVHEHEGAMFFKSESGSTEFVVVLPE